MAIFDSRYYTMSVLSGATYASDSDFNSELGTTLGGIVGPGKQYQEVHQQGAGFGDYGFAAYVFADKSNPTAKTISFRGTEPLDPLDIAADADIATKGAALQQIVDMYNYVSRLKTGTTDQAQQYALTYSLIPPLDGTPYATDLSPLAVGQLPKYYSVQQVGSVTGLGIINPGDTVNLTGHSLGGELALAAGKLFTDKTNQVYTYNALGFQAIANTLGLVDGAGADIIESRKGCFRFLLKQPFRRDVGVWGTSSPPAAGGSYSSTAPCAALLTRAA